MNLWDLLTSSAVQDFIQSSIHKKMDALQISTALNKAGYSNENRAAIMDYMALVPKFRDKFGGADREKINPPQKNSSKSSHSRCDASASEIFLLCDKLALEQSTAQDIGRWKARLWPRDNAGDARTCTADSNIATASKKTVHDLCCGMGGDSFFLPQEYDVIGVDLDENRLAMYRHNTKVFRGERAGKTLLADARTVQAADTTSVTPTAPQTRADFFTIDPARRAVDGENQRDLRNLMPTFAEVLEIARLYQGGMAKLPPGYPMNEVPGDCEIIYLGSHTDCRECLVLFGALAKHPGQIRAVMVDKNVEWSAPRDVKRETRDDANQEQFDHNLELEGKDRIYRTSSSQSDLPLDELGAYLSEPEPVLLRSHLFGIVALASDASAHLISEGIAYVSSEKPLPTPGFANFKVLDHCEIATSAVRAMLKVHDVGKLTLKLRGVKLDPDAEIKRLKPKGKNSAILFYTRLAGEKVAILAERV